MCDAESRNCTFAARWIKKLLFPLQRRREERAQLFAEGE